MRKPELLNLIAQLQAKSELDEIGDLRPFQVIQLLLQYINDPDVDNVIDKVVM